MAEKKASIDFSMVLASSVHDMKNSIGMLLGSLEEVVAETPPENPQQAQRFNKLHYEASRINSELIQLLTIYRMDNDTLPLRCEEHYVTDVIEEQIARNQMLSDTGEIFIEMNCDPSLRWFYDADLIGNVIHNVFVNCVRYTNSTISLRASIDKDCLCLAIADDGPGYPQHMLNKPAGLAFEPGLEHGNTHLGLYFTECIAALHQRNNRHGYISLENNGELGGGVFKLYLP